MCLFDAACAQPQAPVASREAPVLQRAAVAESTTHVLNRDAPWFEHPAQARPADGMLKMNTRVRIVQEAGSYTQVRTADGQLGFVSSESLSPLPGR